MAGNKRIHHAVLAALAILGLIGAACGPAAGRSDRVTTSGVQRVIQDPDNPAARNYAPESATSSSGSRVVQDPDNPAARNYAPENAAISRNGGSGRVVRDPDNPYWNGR